MLTNFMRLLKLPFIKLFRNMAGDILQHSSDNISKRIVWMDLEMTGLDPRTEHILEAACLITDENLNIIAEAPTMVIHQSDEVLNNMNEWCIAQHGKTGLTKQSKESNLSITDAEEKLLSFMKQYTQPKSSPLAGNSIGMDLQFIRFQMPNVFDHLHYRVIDVSTIKELCRRWYPEEFEQMPKKSLSHRALDDIKESIEELKAYRKSIFKNPDSAKQQ